MVTDCRNEASDNTVDIDCILPLTSSTSNSLYAVRQALTMTEGYSATFNGSVSNDASATTIVYCRVRENYDEAQGRYLSPWRKHVIPLPCFSAPTKHINTVSSFSDSTFSVQWNPCKQLSAKQWTSDATFFGLDVMGEVTLFFPSVTFFGACTVREIGNLLDNMQLPHTSSSD